MKRFVLAMALLCAARVEAQVIDVQTPFGGGLFGQLQQWQGQSVKVGASPLRGAGFYLHAATGQGQLSGDLEIRVYDGLASDGGTLLASGNTTYTLTAQTGGWFDVFFAPVLVTPSQTLWLYLLGTQPHGEQIYTRWGMNLYAGGSTVALGSTDITAVGVTDWSYADLTVRTWTDPVVTDPGTPVPEPAPAGVLVLAAGILMLRARRRR